VPSPTLAPSTAPLTAASGPDVAETDLARAATLSGELVRLSRLLTSLRATLAAQSPDGIEWATWTVLFHLVKGGPRRSGALAEALAVDPSTVSRQVATLVQAGYVERRPDPDDGRASLLAATDSGRRVHAAFAERRDRAVACALSGWSDEDVATLAGLLNRFLTDFEGARPSSTAAAAPSGAA
jgi:DNA-binding MarR family transcriptional regulator